MCSEYSDNHLSFQKEVLWPFPILLLIPIWNIAFSLLTSFQKEDTFTNDLIELYLLLIISFPGGSWNFQSHLHNSALFRSLRFSTPNPPPYWNKHTSKQLMHMFFFSNRCAPLSISRQGRETLIRAAVRQEKTASLKAVKSIEKEMVEWGSQCRPMQ